MKCENCIHYEVCCEWNEKFIKHRMGMGDGCVCKNYKDKSLFVELPCKLGDTIWCKDEYFDESYEIVERVITSFMLFKNTIQFYAGKPSNLGWVRAYDITDFGKTVFFTKEDIQKKDQEAPNE